jgi:ankyrin repeat protein
VRTEAVNTKATDMPNNIDTFAKIRTLNFQNFFADAGTWNLQEIGSRGQSLLHEAISSRKFDIAEELLRRGVALNVQDEKGRTALHYAISYGALGIAREIVEGGADLSIVDAFGNAAVWTAALSAKGDYAFVRFLVENGADVTLMNKAGKSVCDFSLQTNNRELWLACCGKNNEFEKI